MMNTTASRPYGTVLANDVFSSGIILSEYVVQSVFSIDFSPVSDQNSTDFRQFQQYLNVTGLDVRSRVLQSFSMCD